MARMSSRRRKAPISRFSSTVIEVKTLSFCGTKAIPFATRVCGDRPVMSSPSSFTLPPRSVSMPKTALGGLAVVLVTKPFDAAAWSAGTPRILLALLVGAAVIFAAARIRRSALADGWRGLAMVAVLVAGFFLFRFIYVSAVNAVEAITPASTGNIGGLGLPVPVSWLVGGVLAAGAAWAVAKTALGLRSDYLAIATLGIGQIVIAVLMNEDWLDRGVKNVIGIGRWPVPEEVGLQQRQWFIAFAHSTGVDVRTASTIFVGLCFAALFTVVLLILLVAAELALKSPRGRMMRAIRDNEIAAEAMGKDVKRRHLQIFVLGSAVIGIAGALYVTLHGLPLAGPVLGSEVP